MTTDLTDFPLEIINVILSEIPSNQIINLNLISKKWYSIINTLLSNNNQDIIDCYLNDNMFGVIYHLKNLCTTYQCKLENLQCDYKEVTMSKNIYMLLPLVKHYKCKKILRFLMNYVNFSTLLIKTEQLNTFINMTIENDDDIILRKLLKKNYFVDNKFNENTNFLHNKPNINSIKDLKINTKHDMCESIYYNSFNINLSHIIKEYEFMGIQFDCDKYFTIIVANNFNYRDRIELIKIAHERKILTKDIIKKIIKYYIPHEFFLDIVSELQNIEPKILSEINFFDLMGNPDFYIITNRIIQCAGYDNLLEIFISNIPIDDRPLKKTTNTEFNFYNRTVGYNEQTNRKQVIKQQKIVKIFANSIMKKNFFRSITAYRLIYVIYDALTYVNTCDDLDITTITQIISFGHYKIIKLLSEKLKFLKIRNINEILEAALQGDLDKINTFLN